MRQFSVGELVTVIPDMFLRHAAPGDYKIIEHERAVRESLLVKSEGYLLDEVPERRPRRKTISLATRPLDLVCN